MTREETIRARCREKYGGDGAESLVVTLRISKICSTVADVIGCAILLNMLINFTPTVVVISIAALIPLVPLAVVFTLFKQTIKELIIEDNAS